MQYLRVCRHWMSASLLVAGGVGSSQVGAQAVSSTFDMSSDGWTIIVNDSSTTADWNPANGCEPVDGCPGGSAGYIADEDIVSAAWAFDAPMKFLGDHLDAYGRTLTFSRVNTVDLDDWNGHPEGPTAADAIQITLVGDGITLVHRAAAKPVTQGHHGRLPGPPVDPAGVPGATWTTATVTLDETDLGWFVGTADTMTHPTSMQFMAVMADITQLSITGDLDMGDDYGGLDEITMVPVELQSFSID